MKPGFWKEDCPDRRISPRTACGGRAGHKVSVVACEAFRGYGQGEGLTEAGIRCFSLEGKMIFGWILSGFS